MTTPTRHPLPGPHAALIDVPLRLRTTPPVPAGTFIEPWREDQEPTAVERAAIRRDGHGCRACGFVSGEHQLAAALDGNRRDLAQTVTLCPFCHQCLHLDRVAAMQSGVLILAPEVEQAALHHMVREALVARVLGGAAAARAEALLAALLARRVAAQARLGSDDPAVLAARLGATPDAERDAALDAMRADLRLLPLPRRLVRKGNLLEDLLPPMLGFWVSVDGPYALKSLRTLPWLDEGLRVFAPAAGLAESAGELAPDPAAIDPTLPEDPAGDGPPRFIFTADPEDRFRFPLHRRLPDGGYEPVGEYRVIDVTESASITKSKLHNMLHIVAGNRHLAIALGQETKRKMVFKIVSASDNGVAGFEFSTFDGVVITKNASLTVKEGVFYDDRKPGDADPGT